MSDRDDAEWDGIIDLSYQRAAVAYSATVRVFCDDESRNFHKRHKRHWLAEFGLRRPELPARHWMRWESVGHATRKPYRYDDEGRAGNVVVPLVEAEIEARGRWGDDIWPAQNSFDDVWDGALDEQGRIVPKKLIRSSNPAVEQARFIDWVGEIPSTGRAGKRSLVHGAWWNHDEVVIPACGCGHELPPIPTPTMVALLDLLADKDIPKINLKALRAALHRMRAAD